MMVSRASNPYSIQCGRGERAAFRGETEQFDAAGQDVIEVPFHTA